MQDNEVKNEYNESYYGVGGFILEIIKIFILAFIIIAPIRVFLFQPFFVKGASMEPNFEDNQYLIINELGYKKTSVGFGDREIFSINPSKDLKRETVVVFRYPKDRKQFFIKRVIGLPGEKVDIKEGKVKIYNSENPDGFILEEKEYLSSSVQTSVSGGNFVINLKDDEYFVMGDNRRFSSDSRSWGPVSKSDIIGTVLFRAWPPSEIKVF